MLGVWEAAVVEPVYEELECLGLLSGKEDGFGSRFFEVSNQSRAEEGRIIDEEVEVDCEADLFGSDDDGSEGGIGAPVVRLVDCMKWSNYRAYDMRGSVGDFRFWVATGFEAILSGWVELMGDGEDVELEFVIFYTEVLRLLLTLKS